MTLAVQTLSHLISPQYYDNENLCSSLGDLRSLAVTKYDSIPKTSSFIQLYPNPAKDQLILDWIEQNSKSGELEVIDLLGNIIINQSVTSNSGSQIIDINTLSSGPYIARLVQSGGTIYQNKVIVIK